MVAPCFLKHSFNKCHGAISQKLTFETYDLGGIPLVNDLTFHFKNFTLQNVKLRRSDHQRRRSRLSLLETFQRQKLLALDFVS